MRALLVIVAAAVLTFPLSLTAAEDSDSTTSPYALIVTVGGTVPMGGIRSDFDASYYLAGGVTARVTPTAAVTAQLDIYRMTSLKPVAVTNDQMQIWSVTLGARLRPTGPSPLNRLFLQPAAGAAIVDFPQEAYCPNPYFPTLCTGYTNRTEVHIALSLSLGVTLINSRKAGLSLVAKPLWVLTGLDKIAVVAAATELRF